MSDQVDQVTVSVRVSDVRGREIREVTRLVSNTDRRKVGSKQAIAAEIAMATDALMGEIPW